ncbi:unnamed protein product [Gadus morhua 'NCC']
MTSVWAANRNGVVCLASCTWADPLGSGVRSWNTGWILSQQYAGHRRETIEVNVSKLFIIVKTCLDNRSTIQNPTGCPVFCDITCRHI